jgi:hypothetical protein
MARGLPVLTVFAALLAQTILDRRAIRLLIPILPGPKSDA